jgi:hypothetical protein
LAKVERPVPWTTALEANRVEHDGHLTPSAPLAATNGRRRPRDCQHAEAGRGAPLASAEVTISASRSPGVR